MKIPRVSGFRDFSRMKQAAIVIGTAAVALATYGAVSALWSANATGTSQSKALTAQTITATASTATADLYPGFTGGDVFLNLANTNPYPVQFTAMVPGTVTSSDQTNCPASNVTVAGKTGLALNVPANGSATAQTIADVVTLASAAPDGCQGVTFSVALTLTGTQTP